MRRLLFALVLLPVFALWRPHWAGEMVDAHNQVRKHVHVEKLKWSEDLAKVAQKWAGHLADRNLFEHSPDPHYGENLFAITGARSSAKNVVEAWAAEERNYDDRAARCLRGACGHYTQIVWRDTREVGCAVARRGKREVWVCEYSPPGNYVGQRPY